MDEVLVFFFVPVVLFLVVVAPVWLVLHYRSKSRAQGELSQAEREELDQLLAEADRMADRIETLEAILDAEVPNWRRRPGEAVTTSEEAGNEQRAQSSHRG